MLSDTPVTRLAGFVRAATLDQPSWAPQIHQLDFTTSTVAPIVGVASTPRIVEELHAAALMELLQPALQRLEALERLTVDWDSYGGDPPSRTALLTACMFLESVGRQLGPFFAEGARPYAVAPVADGGVQLEWRGPSGEIEIEVDPNGQLGYWVSCAEGELQGIHEEEDVDQLKALRALAQVLRPQATN